jgi:hypothetical protein
MVNAHIYFIYKIGQILEMLTLTKFISLVNWNREREREIEGFHPSQTLAHDHWVQVNPMESPYPSLI